MYVSFCPSFTSVQVRTKHAVFHHQVIVDAGAHEVERDDALFQLMARELSEEFIRVISPLQVLIADEEARLRDRRIEWLQMNSLKACNTERGKYSGRACRLGPRHHCDGPL